MGKVKEKEADYDLLTAVMICLDSGKEEKEGNHHTSVLERKGGMGNGSLCTGNVVGKIFKRRFGQLSSVFVEMR